MANEATIRSSLVISKGNLSYSSLPSTFKADVSGTLGPTPGAIVVDLDGVNVDLTQLTTLGWCRIINYDTTNFLDFGIWDPETSLFYPVGRLLAGEFCVFRLSPVLGGEFGTSGGAGTIGPNTNRLQLRADTANVNAAVEAFEA